MSVKYEAVFVIEVNSIYDSLASQPYVFCVRVRVRMEEVEGRTTFPSPPPILTRMRTRKNMAGLRD